MTVSSGHCNSLFPVHICDSLRWRNMTLCDFCKDYGHEVAAEYDGRTVFGSCAYMCIRHFEKFGTGIGHALGSRIVGK